MSPSTDLRENRELATELKFLVNPALAGRALWGEPFRASLRDLGQPVDLVDVFRRSEALPLHLDEILGMSPRPPVVWLQQGIRNDDFAAKLTAAGVRVVQDRCTLAEHRRMGIGPVSR